MDTMKMGKLIAELRKQKGFTQQQLGETLNLSNKTISKWESGAGSPDISNLPILAETLGVSVDELLRGEVDPLDSGAEKGTGHPRVGRIGGRRVGDPGVQLRLAGVNGWILRWAEWILRCVGGILRRGMLSFRYQTKGDFPWNSVRARKRN